MADHHVPARWSSLPRKGQLLVLCLIRITEPIVRFCVNSYIFYQLQSLDPLLPSDEVIKQASYLRTAYMLAQCTSSVIWGRVADSPRGGRKIVMLVGLTFTFLSMLFLGFISSFKQALLLHAIQGFSNSNIAIVRTMVSEVVPQKHFQARAFVLLPICTSIATILGPLIAGLTVEVRPKSQSDDTGNEALFLRYPYALPALINSMVLLVSLLATFFFLEETLEPLRRRYDPGIAVSRKIASLLCFSRDQTAHYEAISLEPDENKEMSFVNSTEEDDEENPASSSTSVEDNDQADEKPVSVLPTRRIFTKKMLLVLFAAVLLDVQIAVTSDAMFNLFSFPVSSKEEERHRVLPFRFGGGAGFKPHSLAWTTSIFGLTGLPFQLWVYPQVTQRLGTLKTWRYFMFAFPSIWFLYPYIAVMPSSTPPPSEKTGFFVWAYVVFLACAAGLFVGCVAPCQLILTALSSPHPSALGRTQGITFFVSTAVRASSSALAGSLLAHGLKRNLAGLPFWFSTIIGVLAITTSPFVKEGNGHEIRLPGDE
ncbi:major facilitator superfamily transporter [Colletotrichum tofieldiae]|uniref:Major facilitator superfamily transporter n=1 Tax=Colletotrichum tofieldiae TaxID=708197 RepID=A0A166TCN1_9PEZI|nr:major facilitator superfamily transporter [Colletotrichum tofieldiae]